MSFRTRLLLIFALTVATAVSVVVWIASTATLNAFERLDGERAEALIQQFRREFTRRRDQIAARAERVAGACREAARQPLRGAYGGGSGTICRRIFD